MELSPKTRHEHFLARAAGDTNALELQPKTREEHFLQNIIDAIEQGGGGGGSGTDPNAVHYTAETKTSAEKAQARANIGATDASTSIPDDVKQALLNCLSHVSWVDTDSGRDCVAALSDALYLGPLESIEATFTQGANVIYATDSLEVLRQYLTVTADYTIGGEVEVTGYSLSGTLTTGSSTITVSYGGKTDTFSVTVTESVDVTPALSSFVPSSASAVSADYDSAENSLAIHTLTNGTYRDYHVSWTMEEGYEYAVSYDVKVYSGVHRGAFTAGSSGVAPSSGNKTSNAHVEFTTQYSSTVTMFRFYCTWSTSEAGSCKISNFKIYKRPILAGA